MEENKLKDPKTAYRKRSMLWALCNEDFSDLTKAQIAEVFNTSPTTVQHCMSKIKRETGFVVKYIKCDVKGNKIEQSNNEGNGGELNAT